MANHFKILIGLFLFLFVITSYAIQVKVQSPSQAVSALGFTVNGKNYGGAGKSYSKGNMPAGAMYSFGVRVNGLFGNDVGCSAGGRNMVKLNKDATAILVYDGSKCTVRLR